jgi:hypothetical protein
MDARLKLLELFIREGGGRLCRAGGEWHAFHAWLWRRSRESGDIAELVRAAEDESVLAMLAAGWRSALLPCPGGRVRVAWQFPHTWQFMGDPEADAVLRN